MDRDIPSFIVYSFSYGCPSRQQLIKYHYQVDETAIMAIVGYGWVRGGTRIISSFCAYAAILEFAQQFSPGRHSAMEDLVVSALGALCGGLAIVLLRARYPSL